MFQREKRDYVWIFGNSPINNTSDNDNTLLNFSPQTVDIDSHNWDWNFLDTNASICDTAGNLLLITNGIELRNASNDGIGDQYGANLVFGGFCGRRTRL